MAAAGAGVAAAAVVAAPRVLEVDFLHRREPHVRLVPRRALGRVPAALRRPAELRRRPPVRPAGRLARVRSQAPAAPPKLPPGQPARRPVQKVQRAPPRARLLRVPQPDSVLRPAAPLPRPRPAAVPRVVREKVSSTHLVRQPAPPAQRALDEPPAQREQRERHEGVARRPISCMAVLRSRRVLPPASRRALSAVPQPVARGQTPVGPEHPGTIWRRTAPVELKTAASGKVTATNAATKFAISMTSIIPAISGRRTPVGVPGQ